MLPKIVACIGLALCSLLSWNGLAAGQAPPYPEPPPPAVTTTAPEVLPEVVVNNPTTTAAPSVAGVSVSRGSSLPVTGGDLLGLAVLGAGATAVGGAMVLARRRLP